MSEPKSILYELKRRRGQRSIRVSVHPGGRVLVTAGLMMPKAFIEDFLSRKRAWIEQSVAKMSDWTPGLLSRKDPQDYRENKARALKMIKERVEYFNQTYGHVISDITVRNMKRQWGSCSRTCRLNFNYKLIHLPQELADYVIVHELAHLAVFNHSPKFWQEVGRLIPDYRQRRIALRKIGNGSLG
jgi:predicted metal-dependent hydrolase